MDGLSSGQLSYGQSLIKIDSTPETFQLRHEGRERLANQARTQANLVVTVLTSNSSTPKEEVPVKNLNNV